MSDIKTTISNLQDPLDHVKLDKASQYVSCLLKELRSLAGEAVNSIPIKQPNITFVLYPEGGMGDVMFIHKLAQEFLDRGCVVNIAVMNGREMSREMIVEKLRALPGASAMNILTPENIDKSNFDTSCVVVGPTRPSVSSILSDFPEFKNFSMEFVGEYCSQKSVTLDVPNNSYSIQKAAGIRPHELGIYKKGGLKPALTHKERITQLNQLRTNANIETIFNGKETASYLESNKLYFGYGHQSAQMSKFVDIIAAVNTDNEKDIDVVLPWRLEDRDRNKYEFWLKAKINKKHLEKSGITNVEIIVDGVIVKTEKISDKTPSKTLRIRNIFPIPNNTFGQLMQAAEPLVFTTGDQSWNETMLFAGKIPVYETMSWKKELRAAQIELAQSTPLMYKFLDSIISNNIAKTAKAFKELEKADKVSIDSGQKSETVKYHEEFFKIESFPDSLLNQLTLLISTKDHPEILEPWLEAEKRIKESFTPLVILEEASFKLAAETMAQVNNSPKDRIFDNSGDIKPNLMTWWKENRTKPPFDDEVRSKMDKVVSLLDRVIAKDLTVKREELIAAAIPVFRLGDKILELCKGQLKLTKESFKQN